MPLFHDPPRRPEVQLKQELKRWEHSFFKVNGRKPGKEDIAAAGEDVALMYKNYWSVVKGHPLHAKHRKCRSKQDSSAAEETDEDQHVPQERSKLKASSQKGSDLTGTWGDDRQDDNYFTIPATVAAKSPAVQPFLSRLRKLHLSEHYVKTNMDKGLFSLKRRKKTLQTGSQSLDLESESDAGPLFEMTDPFRDSSSVFATAADESLASCIPSHMQSSDISPSSGISSFSGSSFKENESTNHSSSHRGGSNSSGYPSIKLFDEDEDNTTEQEIAKVKGAFAETLDDAVNFDGCELLPIDFKRKKGAAARNPPTAKSLKKRNENYLKINMKKKSYASRGYKKIDVTKEKRKAHYKLKRNCCFTCGESGHWRHECPLINKPVSQSKPTATATADPESESGIEGLGEPEAMETDQQQLFDADNEDGIPFLPADHIILTDTEEQYD